MQGGLASTRLTKQEVGGNVSNYIGTVPQELSEQVFSNFSIAAICNYGLRWVCSVTHTENDHFISCYGPQCTVTALLLIHYCGMQEERARQVQLARHEYFIRLSNVTVYSVGGGGGGITVSNWTRICQ